MNEDEELVERMDRPPQEEQPQDEFFEDDFSQ
jgi:hypothetical protein